MRYKFYVIYVNLCQKFNSFKALKPITKENIKQWLNIDKNKNKIYYYNVLYLFA